MSTELSAAASHSAANTSNRPYPQRTDKLPRHLDNVTREWLESTLRNRYPGLAIRDMKVVEVRNGHTTKMRVELDLNEAGVKAGIPRQVCLKANWSEGFNSGDICELEARFYNFMRELPNVPVARSYFSDWDGDGSGQGVVMMEDLAADGGTFGHSTQQIGVDGVAKALESLARLHAALWNSPKLKDTRWLPTSMNTPIDNNQLRMMYPYVEMNIVKPEYIAFLPKWFLEDQNRFIRAFDLLCLYEQNQKGPLCIVHGDSHLGNSYVRRDGERVWLDWQLVRKGHPWRDVTYLMLGALTIEERRKSERDLHKHYLESLASKGAKDIPTADELWNHYRRWPFYGMQSWVANVDAWGQNGLHVTERFFTAAEDHESLKLLEGQLR
jgi:hypothetical protein